MNYDDQTEVVGSLFYLCMGLYWSFIYPFIKFQEGADMWTIIIWGGLLVIWTLMARKTFSNLYQIAKNRHQCKKEIAAIKAELERREQRKEEFRKNFFHD